HTAESYADWFNECSRLMRRVDPTVKLGALMGTGTGPPDAWNRKVLERTRGNADFIIVHTYAVGLWGQPARQLDGDCLMRACMAAGEQLELRLAHYRELIRRHTGRDIPLAITEYNASFVQQEPVPYRFSYGPALFSADYVRALLRPEANVLMANYWHFINGYWGMVQGPRLPDEQPRVWKKMPAFHLYRLWGQHFGDRLVHVEVEGPRLDFEGVLRVRPAIGQTGLPEGLDPDANLLEGLELHAGEGAGWRSRRTAPDSAVMDIDGLRGESFPRLFTISPIQPGSYRLSYVG
ncbi:unnamed protein product, partial [marine sediment metagenome]